jgi:hypothetical protein
LLFIAGSGAALAADANNFCVNPSGIVRLLLPPATACRANETLLTINQQGGGGSPTVVDQTGTVIGALFELNRVIMDIGGNKVVIGVGQNGLENINGTILNSTPSVWFTTTNCSGTPYLFDFNFPPQGFFSSNNPQTGGTLYYATGGLTTAPVLQSTFNGSCLQEGGPDQVYPAQSTTVNYVTPFSVK